MPVSDFAPEPPIELPPARTVHVRGRGEFFVRDSGLFEPSADRPTVMLLHGWMATADLNWVGAYNDLIAAGYHPGPLFSEILEAVEDAQLEGRIASSGEALAMVREQFPL
jgi:hypothetical protein